MHYWRKCFLVTFKRHGERRQHEETIGRGSQGWTAARANTRRSELISVALTKREEAEEALRKQRGAELEKGKNKHLYFTVARAMDAYLEHLDSESKKQDESRHRLHLKPCCVDKPVSKLEPMDLLKTSKAIKKKGVKSPAEKHVLADLLAAKQSRLLESLTDEKIEKMNGRDPAWMVTVLFDKERLQRDKSTGNLAVLSHAALVEAACADKD